jgi:hypothetical protein
LGGNFSVNVLERSWEGDDAHALHQKGSPEINSRPGLVIRSISRAQLGVRFEPTLYVASGGHRFLVHVVQAGLQYPEEENADLVERIEGNRDQIR